MGSPSIRSTRSSAAATAAPTRWSTRVRSRRRGFAPGATTDERWRFIHADLSGFAGRRLSLNQDVYASASETSFRNRSIAHLLQSYGRISLDPAEATDLDTKQCSLNVSAKDLAVIGATLARGGVNPITKQQVVDATGCPYAPAAMATGGLYETSGDWLYDIGLPGKCGIGGGIVTICWERVLSASLRAVRCCRERRERPWCCCGVLWSGRVSVGARARRR
jgi:hypothetical protein